MIQRINKKALFDYSIEKTRECGIVLFGHEVKSMKQNNFSAGEAIIRFQGSVLFLINCHIDQYVHASIQQLGSYNPTRPRILLAHRKELGSMFAGIRQGGGATLILTKIYSRRHFIKCEVALAKKKKNITKKSLIKERDTDRQVKQDLARLGF
ncbi:MAG: SsrA-binding protein [Candidatus Absconditabacterales bacterium]|nr:SsrA-binding protein [Candidatus Absconditabacterales bacterium]